MTESTHVLLLCWRDTDHPQGGGSERYLERVGAELVDRGMRVTLLTAAHDGAAADETRDGIRILRAGGRLSVYPRALGTILAARLGRGRLGRTDPDVIVDTQNGIPFFAALVSRAPTVVLVHHCHREQWPVAGRGLGRFGWFLESRVSPRVHRRNRYVTVSGPSAVELAELGVDRARITVIRNGVDPLPGGLSVADMPRRDDRAIRLCVLSRLVPHKQVEDALAVVAELRHIRPEIHLDVIGGGWWSDELRRCATELGVERHVTFHGHVAEVRKHELLARAHVHLMPSRKEGWGLAVMEAAQHRVPTIGYRSSVGLVESIEDDETGLLVDGVDELISATRKLIDNPDEVARLGDNAERKAHHYSWSATADGFIEVFDDVRRPRPLRGRTGSTPTRSDAR
ncbi:glycosyltransferase family 4 protein [Gordonia insulae]|uniref:GDP-mannose-dependent alpha-(1-6)-phosphatidylinositol monomannoside mannosyltransferase n=1 Tax=Gordonia insulae TaxID=2420509 RepID=A0A3G8JMN3_9ACTN|nr:glycosyltransferase family 4 protein [Gordonia insulae]AZG46351.1 GDP-mannose-dependent alpha-(1-6)-phosphatidylinositol monomannoside mannosyltransferase [Gordonia insulae]